MAVREYLGSRNALQRVVRRIHWLTTLGTAIVAIALAFVMAARSWPFTESAARKTLEARTGRDSRIGRFQETYFPPGFIAEDIRLMRHTHPDKEPLISIDKMVVVGSWWRILTLTRVVPRVDIYHLHLLIPPRGAAADGKQHELITPKKLTGPAVVISSMRIYQTTLDFLPGETAAKAGQEQPYRMQVSDLFLTDVGKGQQLTFETKIQNTMPRGEIRVKGLFGPWDSAEPARTPIQADYTFQNAKLSDIPGISGTLQAKGRFWGTLDREQTEGEATVPDFHVSGSTHSESLKSVFQAAVDATDGNVTLQKLDTTFGKTMVHAEGTVSGAERAMGKTAVLKASVANGRVDDLEKMFTHSKTPPLTGRISLQTSIRLPPGNAKFLERLEMNGDFETSSGRFTSADTQGMLNRLSESAQGESKTQQNTDGSSVSSRMRSHVVLKGGVAHIQNLTLEAPDTLARMDGTFNLISKEVNLQGTLKTDGKLSDTQTGFKAFAVKLITPFLKKQHATVVPFEMKGTYGNLTTRLDLDGKRKL